MDLIREILFYVEQSQDGPNPINVQIPERSDFEITYHLAILEEAGLLIVPEGFTTADGLNTFVERLTWSGHEFLESSRSPKNWEIAKKHLLEKAGSLPFTVLQSFLISLIKGEVSF